VAERLIVGPILKTLVFSTTPEATRAWVDSICTNWNFTSIVPAVGDTACMQMAGCHTRFWHAPE
jgi:hypothetical protein